nr:coiled-coil domain-containing protein 138-like [Lytechinus pictus]
MSRKFYQHKTGRLFSDDLSSIPDIGTQQGYEMTSQQSPERAADMNTSPMSHQLTSEERKHYDRALRDMCKIIKASSRRLGDVSPQTDKDERFLRSMKQRVYQDRHTLSEELATLSDPDVTLQIGASYDERTSNGLGLAGRRKHDLYDYVDEDYEEEAEVEDDDYQDYRTSPPSTQKYHKAGRRDDDARLSPGKSSGRVEAVYAELVTISSKLQKQNIALQEREKALEKRERSLQNLEETLQTDHSSIRQAYKDFNNRWHKLEEEHRKQVKELEDTIKERTKEIKRQKESFDTLKQANDGLRNQLDKVEEQNKKLESQAISLQSRLTNLLRKQELTSRQRDQESMAVKAKVETVKRRVDGSAQKSVMSRSTKQSSGLYDALGILLEWVSEVHLRHYSDDPSKPLESMPSQALTHDRCIRILPSLVEVLGQLPSHAAKLHLPCLQFIYWSLLCLQSSDKQQISLSSTYRRLGDELYRPQVVRFASDRDKTSPDPAQTEKPKSAIFFKSTNLHIRFLSSLIIMKTVTQVDYLANVFDVLRCDLKDDRAKELYLRYQATPLILSHLRASNRAITGCAVDIFLQMSMESIFMQQFLYSCCNDVWFKSCAALLSSSGMDIKVVEKLSIILQKLSKIKTNKNFFDSSGTSVIIQEMSRSRECQENAFLALNLRSILFNLNHLKPSSSSTR